jgi:hypothetical protein
VFNDILFVIRERKFEFCRETGNDEEIGFQWRSILSWKIKMIQYALN